MLTYLIAQTLDPGQRLGAVHEHFNQRTASDSLQVVYLTLIAAVLLCGALVLLNRIQRASQRREEQAGDQRREEMTAKLVPSHTISRDLSLIDKRKASRQMAGSKH